MKGLTLPSRVKVNAAGDWQILPPAGQITQIGDAGATSRGLVANDDLFVSGKLEVDGVAEFETDANFRTGIVRSYGALRAQASFTSYTTTLFHGATTLDDEAANLRDRGANLCMLFHGKISEELTIAVGVGAAGVNTAANLAPADSIITAVAVRVTQAPGGGATVFDVGRTGGNLDEFIDGVAVALGTTGTSAANGDGVNPGPVHNAAANTLTVTTDANVLVTDMKVRICTWYQELTPPTS